MPLSIFGFRALWSPYFFAFTVLLVIGYFLLFAKKHGRFKNSRPLQSKEAVLFLISMALLYIIKGSPVDLMAHIMFSFHMVQMAFLYLVIPPLFILGIPNWAWKNVIEIPFINKIFKLFTRPLIALVMFNGLFSIYHIPMVMDFVKMNFFLHALYTVVLFVFALFLWWPLVNTLPGQYQLHGLKKVGYILADGVLLTPACGLIIFAPDAMYATYTDGEMWLKAMELCVPGAALSGLSGMNITGPELFTNMGAQEDQQLGGVLMKIIQEIVLATILARVFFEWYKKEQEQEGTVDAINAQVMNEDSAMPDPRPAE